MNSSCDNLSTIKFEKLRKEPKKFMASFKKGVLYSGFDKSIRLLKSSNIAVSRNANHSEEKLFDEAIDFLEVKFPSKKRKVKKVRKEVAILRQVYKNIFSKVPNINDRLKQSREKLIFLVCLELYLTTNKNAEVFMANADLRETFFPLAFDVNRMSVDELNFLQSYHHFVEEQTREVRGILLYFSLIEHSSTEEVAFSWDDIVDQMKYIKSINDFWIFEHVYELWSYLDMSLVRRGKTLFFSSSNYKRYKAWMISNYRSRESHQTKQYNHLKHVEDASGKPEVGGFKKDNLSHWMCMEYFFAFPSEVFINEVSVYDWLEVYNALAQYAKRVVDERKHISIDISFSGCFEVKSKKEWLTVLSGSGVKIEAISKIFSKLVLNSEDKSNNGDIFDHPFYQLAKDEFILFSSVASGIDPIQCLKTISNTNHHEIRLGKYRKAIKYIDSFEREVGAGLEKMKVPFASNVYFSQDCNYSRPFEGEFDFIFSVDNVFFFIECKKFPYPFYFKQHQINYEKLSSEAGKFNQKVDFVIQNPHSLKKQNPKLSNWFPDKKTNRRRVRKILITSFPIGEIFFVDNCQIMDVETFNYCLLNKEATVKEISSRRKVDVLLSKSEDSLITRFNNLAKHQPINWLMKEQCKLITRQEKTGDFDVVFPHYERIVPEIVYSND